MPKRALSPQIRRSQVRRELEPAADAQAPDLGDHRMPAADDRLHRGVGALVIPARLLDRAPVLLELADVGADAERALAGAGEDHAAQALVGVELGEDLAQPGPHLIVDGIQLGRLVERDLGDLALDARAARGRSSVPPPRAELAPQQNPIRGGGQERFSTARRQPSRLAARLHQLGTGVRPRDQRAWSARLVAAQGARGHGIADRRKARQRRRPPPARATGSLVQT